MAVKIVVLKPDFKKDILKSKPISLAIKILPMTTVVKVKRLGKERYVKSPLVKILDRIKISIYVFNTMFLRHLAKEKCDSIIKSLQMAHIIVHN